MRNPIGIPVCLIALSMFLLMALWFHGEDNAAQSCMREHSMSTCYSELYP
jgi:hypothetical protein